MRDSAPHAQHSSQGQGQYWKGILHADLKKRLSENGSRVSGTSVGMGGSCVQRSAVSLVPRWHAASSRTCGIQGKIELLQERSNSLELSAVGSALPDAATQSAGTGGTQPHRQPHVRSDTASRLPTSSVPLVPWSHCELGLCGAPTGATLVLLQCV
jgi:hypothetical protein